MIIQSFISGPLNTNAYVVACAETKQAIVIDPAPGSTDAVYTYCIDHNLECQAILLTHSHWDHIADVEPLSKRNKAPIYIHSFDTFNLSVIKGTRTEIETTEQTVTKRKSGILNAE